MGRSRGDANANATATGGVSGEGGESGAANGKDRMPAP